MLYTEKALRDALAKGEFSLKEGDRLTPSAWDLLESRKGIKRWGDAHKSPHANRDRTEGRHGSARSRIWEYPGSLERGEASSAEKKPEHMTHLKAGELVPKTHPRIAFRGKLDSLESEILLCMKEPGAPVETLEEMLVFSRSLMRADVLGEPVKEMLLHGMDERELRHRSHNPQKYYGTAHILPGKEDSTVLLRLNRLRTAIRETELKSYEAFPDRTDIHRALNRLSSLCWILCLEERGREKGNG